MSSPSFHHQDVHSVILEDTPTAPPKPKRGIPRVVAPMKPQRSALKIEPLHNDNKENASQASDTKFKATDANDKMLSYFKRSIAVLRSSSEFTGAEATDILEAFITSHKDLFKKEDLGRKNAVMVLEWWRKENVLKNVAVSDKKFEDSDRAYYILCGAENDTTLFYANSPITSKQLDDSSSLNRSSRRNNSFKRFFSPLVRRNRSNSRGRNDKDNSSTILKSTWSLFSGSDRNEKKAKQAAEQMIKEEECEIYELALFHLLSIIEVEFLEDVAIPLNDSKKHLSFLSSIMEKMGIGINEERLDSRKEDEMDLLIETHPLIRQASAWFQMARVCAPLLYLEPTEGKSRVMQLYLWCKAALSAVTQRLEKMTVNGSSPLFPNEFSPLLSKIAEQLINDMNSGEKLKLAILYLFLMVPTPLRVMIDQIIQWLQLTLRTDAVEDLRSPYYLGRKESRHKENCTVIIDELRTFLFPKGCMTQAQQNIFIETMIELRNEKQLGKMPTKLAEAYKFKCVNSRKSGYNSQKKEENDLTPVRYTVRNEGLRPKELDKKLEGLSETEIALVQMIESILDNKKMSLTEKKKHLVDFSKHYPSLYEKYFKGML